jgi:hypothetical protein
MLGWMTGNYASRPGFPLTRYLPDALFESRFHDLARVPVASMNCCSSHEQSARPSMQPGCDSSVGCDAWIWTGRKARTSTPTMLSRKQEEPGRAYIPPPTVRALGSASGQNPVPAKKTSSSLLAESHVCVVFDERRQREL